MTLGTLDLGVMRTLDPTKTDKDKAHELTNIGVGVVFVCLCLCLSLSLYVWVEGADTPLPRYCKQR